MVFLRVAVCAVALSLGIGSTVVAKQQEEPQDTGTIMGSVSTPSGAPIVGADVAISGLDGDQTFGTDDGGHYVASGLAPGVYDVTISADTFKSVQKRNVAVSGGSKVEVDAKLEEDSAPPQQITEILAQLETLFGRWLPSARVQFAPIKSVDD